MPRPRKSRMVCHYPSVQTFGPREGETKEEITLSVEEYETIRLIDYEGLSQEQCAAFMQVARTTVQQIYADARKKLSAALVEGKNLRISGGDFRLCDGAAGSCGEVSCYKKEYAKLYRKPKGEQIMRIAVTYENGQIFQHFGHTSQFKVYDVRNGEIISAEVVDTNGSGHGALAGVLTALNADVLICGGIGGGAQMALAAAGIQLYGGVSGSADAAAEAFVSGKLNFNPNVQCNHHGEHHHHHEGGCGSHGCGGNHHCGGHH